MFMIFTSAVRALSGLTAPGMGKIFLACLASTLLLLSLMGAGFGWLGGLVLTHYRIENVWLVWLMGGLGTYLLVLFLFPLVMPVLVSFFDEQIAERIERNAYPRLAIGKPQPVWEDVRADMAFTLRALVLNILCLVLLLAGPLYFLGYYLLNSYLLGTQFFMMAGGRHIGRPAARAMARRHRLLVASAGMLIILAAQVPFLNLIAPFWGVAMMVHLYQRLSPPPQVLAPVM